MSDRIASVASLARALVYVERESRCVVCGRIVRPQTEARRWAGETVVHVQCASELAGPGGR